MLTPRDTQGEVHLYGLDLTLLHFLNDRFGESILAVHHLLKFGKGDIVFGQVKGTTHIGVVVLECKLHIHSAIRLLKNIESNSVVVILRPNHIVVRGEFVVAQERVHACLHLCALMCDM